MGDHSQNLRSQQNSQKSSKLQNNEEAAVKKAMRVDVEKATKYNKGRKYHKNDWHEIQSRVYQSIGKGNGEANGVPDENTAHAVALWQAHHMSMDEIDGKVGDSTFERITGRPLEKPEQQEPAVKPSLMAKAPEEKPAADKKAQNNDDIPTQRDLTQGKTRFGTVEDAKSQQTYLTVPYPMFYKDSHRLAGNPTMRIKCHRLIKDRLYNIFVKTMSAYTEDEINEYGLNLCSGCYVVKGAGNKSVHSWGLAVDIDGAHNPNYTMDQAFVAVYKQRFKKEAAGKSFSQILAVAKKKISHEAAKAHQQDYITKYSKLDKPECAKFWDIVESEGGHSLGRHAGRDWMHFQFASFSKV